MIKKVLVFNHTGWNQIVASLVEGLKFNKQLEILSTGRSNYGQDILIKSEREYSVNKLYNASDEDAPPSLYTSSNVIPTAYFHSDNENHNMLHQYCLYYYKDKIIMINPGDFSGSDKMYGSYFGGDPSYYKVYFKREKDLSLNWADNVEPMPFSAEERYFTSGKNFDNIWGGKDLNLSCFKSFLLIFSNLILIFSFRG